MAMKLVTSTGDFSWYGENVAEKIKLFRGSKFKYINLEQTGVIPEFFEETDYGWKRLAEDWAEAADYAGVKFVVSHAPCLNAFQPLNEETFLQNVRAIRRSIEICHILGIDRIVVHACPNQDFTVPEFYKQNKLFYSQFFDQMEKYGITVMTENWDNFKNQPLSTGKDMRAFVDYIDHPLLGICWDTAHANINGKARERGPYQNILDMGDKLKGLHISDNFGDSHHHSWPFAGNISFDEIMQGLLDVNYDGYFTFEASYTLCHHKNPPYGRSSWEYKGEMVTKLLDPPVELKKKAVDLLYDTGSYILQTYDCFEE